MLDCIFFSDISYKSPNYYNVPFLVLVFYISLNFGPLMIFGYLSHIHRISFYHYADVLGQNLV